MSELLHGSLVFLLWVIPVLAVMGVARCILKVPDELFRKILHFLLLGIYAVILFTFETWWIAAGFALLLVVLIYPVLILLGRLPTFSSFVNERWKGEYRLSLVLALSVMAISIGICWGWLGDRYLVLACIYAWGVGDGLAALIGKRFGKHKIHLKFTDGRKSVEGSATMFLASTLSVLAVLLIRGGLDVGGCLIISVAAAAASTVAELYSRNGYDTVTCPAVAMLVILPLVQLLEG